MATKSRMQRKNRPKVLVLLGINSANGWMSSVPAAKALDPVLVLPDQALADQAPVAGQAPVVLVRGVVHRSGDLVRGSLLRHGIHLPNAALIAVTNLTPQKFVN
jgi:hypothetical protein